VSFTITISPVSESQLGPLIANLKLAKGMNLGVIHQVPNEQVKGKTKSPARFTADTILHMSGRSPKKSEALREALVIFEKLEKFQGIGTVTVGNFQQALIQRHKAKSLYTRLRNEGYLDVDAQGG